MVGGDHFQQHAAADHITDGIQRADLVEMDLAHRHAVGFALRVGNAVVDRLGIGLDPVGDRQMRDDVGYIQRGVVVMMVMMAVLQFLLSVDRQMHMGAGLVVRSCFFIGQRDAGQLQCGKAA